jgi:trimeric autotransporter adhesin
MNTRKTLIWNGSGGMCTMALRLVLLLGFLLVPLTNATGSAESDSAAGAMLPGDDGWSALGTGANGGVHAIAVSDKDVYVGGMFADAGTCTSGCNNIAKWNTETHSWSALGQGLNGEVLAIAVHNNLVYVGGAFSLASGVPTNRIAVWNGSSWSGLGAGMNEAVLAIAISNGNVYAGGYFTQAGGCAIGCNFIAKWDGSSWSALGAGMNNYVYALADGGSVIYAGGSFDNADSVPDTTGIAVWNNTGWHALGTGMSGVAGSSVNAIAVSGSDVYAGGTFDLAGGVPATNIAKWNSGNGWSKLSPEMCDNGAIKAITASSSAVYAGGSFKDSDCGAPNHVAVWNSGTGWLGLGQGTDADVYALAISGLDVFVGGSFTLAGGMNAHAIAKYHLSSFQLHLPLVLRSQ